MPASNSLLLFLNAPRVHQELLKPHYQHTVLIVVAHHIVLGYNHLAETVAHSPQRTLLLKAFLRGGNREGRLHINPLVSSVAHKVYLNLSSSVIHKVRGRLLHLYFPPLYGGYL